MLYIQARNDIRIMSAAYYILYRTFVPWEYCYMPTHFNETNRKDDKCFLSVSLLKIRRYFSIVNVFLYLL